MYLGNFLNHELQGGFFHRWCHCPQRQIHNGALCKFWMIPFPSDYVVQGTYYPSIRTSTNLIEYSAAEQFDFLCNSSDATSNNSSNQSPVAI